MSKLTAFKSVLLYQTQNTHFAIFVKGDINKYALYVYCYSKLFKKYFASYQFVTEKKDKFSYCHDL